MPAKEGGEDSTPRPRPAMQSVRCEEGVRNRTPSRGDVKGPGEEGGGGGPSGGPRPAVVEAACTWAHPLRPSGCQEAADRGSAQALVQVGRGEEGIGGQAHGQEAPDHGGAKTTFQEKNRETSELSAVGLRPRPQGVGPQAEAPPPRSHPI